MEGIRVPARKDIGRERLQLIAFGLIMVLAGGVSSRLFAAPRGIPEQGQEQSAQEREAEVAAARADVFRIAGEVAAEARQQRHPEEVGRLACRRGASDERDR